MKNRKKIIIVTDSYYPATGGVENAILELSKDISQEYKVNIISSLKVNNISGLFKRTALAPKFAEYLDPNGINVKPLTPSLWGRIIMLPLILWHLPLLKRFNAPKLFDIISIFYSLAIKRRLQNLIAGNELIISYSTSFTAITLSKIARKLNIPLINAPVIHFSNWGDSPKQIKAYGKSSLILCPTNHFKSVLSKYYKNGFICKTAVIPHLIKDHYNKFKKPDIEIEINNFILFVGRREEHKGLNFLVSSYKKSYCNIPLVIIGPGEPVATEENIIDLGKVAEPEKEWLLRNCRFLAVPSKDESFGLVYLEAMSRGKPSLALNVPPVNELLKDQKTALLSVPGDSATFAENLRKLSENDNLLNSLSENCYKEFEERFSYKRVSDNYFRIIKQTINKL